MEITLLIYAFLMYDHFFKNATTLYNKGYLYLVLSACTWTLLYPTTTELHFVFMLYKFLFIKVTLTAQTKHHFLIKI